MSNPTISLKSLAENKTPGISKATTFRVDPNLIQFEEGFNLRVPSEQLDAENKRLYLAMKAGAVVPPVDVSVDKETGVMTARDGHRRTAAAKRLRAENEDYTLECTQLRGNDTDTIFHMVGRGTGALPLTPLEAGRGYLRLINVGFKPSAIAARLGISQVTVTNGLSLAEAPQEVQNMIEQGQVSSTTAREAIQQGAEGVKALVEAGKAEAAKPVGKKPRKKKAVTAAKLRGTKAEKKAAAKKKAEEKQPELPIAGPYYVTNLPDPNGINQPSQCIMSLDTDEIGIKLKKDVAKNLAEWLRAFAAEDATFQEFAANLEMAMM